ncbi:TetR/AcrR family transcriptional regulator, partial [Blautia sp.]
MNSENNTKQMLIEAAYNMILEKGAENIRVRDLAKRVGCSAAALYKHFESLDYLLALASVR